MVLLRRLVLFLAIVAAMVLPQGNGDNDSHFPNPLLLDNHVVAPATTTEAPSLTVQCNNRYCDGSTSWCFYWGGITSYDLTLGPVPGETRTALGECSPTTNSLAPTDF